MKYFHIFMEPTYVDAPCLHNWYNILDPRKICLEQAHLIPKRVTVQLVPNINLSFPDIISSPYFLVSEMVQELIELYQPHTIYKKIILTDLKYKHIQMYYLPIFETLDCLSDSAELNLDRSVIKKIVLDRKKIGRNHIFRIANVKGTYVIASLDFVESMLIREAVGISLVETELC